MAELKFDDIKKQNLIAVLFALECITDVVYKFSEDEFKKLQEKILHYFQINNNTPCSVSCSLKYPKSTKNWCTTCKDWKNLILDYHICGPAIGDKRIDWTKIDSSKWPTDQTEIAKCFSPPLGRGVGQNHIEDDLSVIIGRIINCRELRNLFHNNPPLTSSVDPDEIRIIRNNIHHGPNELSTDIKNDHFKKLMAFIQMPCLWVYQEARDAFNKIQIFKMKNYQDIIKEKVIDEHEMRKMENRITQNWTKCYNISIVSIALVIILVLLPLVIMLIQQVFDLLYYATERFKYGHERGAVANKLVDSRENNSNISTVSLLVLVILLLVPLVILSLRELKKTRYYVYVEIFFERLFMKSAWRGKQIKGVMFVKREEWGAEKPKPPEQMPSPVGNVFVHHTGGPFYEDEEGCSQRVKYIQYTHMEGNKWDDIAYNFVIGEDGRVYEGRGWNTVGAHTLGWNKNSICFAFIGDYNERSPNHRAIQALENALEWGVKNGKLTANYILYGHCDKRSTDSPGRYLYAIIRYFKHYHKKQI